MPGLKSIHIDISDPLDCINIFRGYFSGTAASQSEAM